MESFKKFIIKNFEQFFVLIILAGTVGINSIIDQKLAFLNFYFLPIVVSGYYLGTRKSVIGALLSSLAVIYFCIRSPENFQMNHSNMNLFLHLTVWSSFLLLVAAVVGKQQEKLIYSLNSLESLNSSLQGKQSEINVANQALLEYSSNLENMVKVRTEELEKSKQTLESLKSKVESTLYSTMDASVARLIIEGRIRSDKKSVSVLFADLKSFTTYSEDRSPELVVKDLNRFLSEMEPIIEAYHGHLDKFLGDGLMCEFGAPFDYENYRLLAVLTGLKMQQRMNELLLPWKMRIGVASGPAIIGLIGAKRQSYTSIGDVVNVASRLESQCPAGEFLIDKVTYEGCRQFIEAQPFHLDQGHDSDEQKFIRIEQIELELERSIDNQQMALLYAEKSELEANVGDLGAALASIQNAIKLNTHHQDYRLRMADLVLAQQNEQNLKLKGRRKTVKAYKVLRIKNAFSNYEKIPETLLNQYRAVVESIKIPSDLTLRVEAIDGTIGHSQSVALLAYAIATKMNLFDSEIDEILVAAFAADLGKVIVPHHLLNRNGALTPTELDEVRKHPMESVRILKSLGYDSPSLLKMVQASHERMDGSGYPEGLRGDQISLGARIIAVADTYDAMTSWRPYREKLEKEPSIDLIMTLAEKGQLDSAVVQALVDIVQSPITVGDKNVA